MNWYLEVLKKYAVFSGRARRKEYWMFVLFSCIIAFVLGVVGGIFTADIGILFALVLPYWLAVLLPSLAVGVRRLHDTGRSGWWSLIASVPIIGPIVLLVFMAQDSHASENQYGPNPKIAVAA